MTIVRCPSCNAKLELALPRGRPGPAPKFDHQQALALIKLGATQSEVAEAFGVSRQAISALVKRDQKQESNP